MDGVVETIHVADRESGPLRPVDEASLVPGRGIEGDRYFAKGSLEPHQEVTLVEAEQIEQFVETLGVPISPHETRRNIVTRGVRLNELVGTEFRIGAAKLRGIELCEPCGLLGRNLASRDPSGRLQPADVVARLAHRAGLRAQILEGGRVRPGDPIAVP